MRPAWSFPSVFRENTFSMHLAFKMWISMHLAFKMWAPNSYERFESTEHELEATHGLNDAQSAETPPHTPLLPQPRAPPLPYLLTPGARFVDARCTQRGGKASCSALFVASKTTKLVPTAGTTLR